MRQPTIFAKSVVNLLGLNFRCQVEETPNSFNCTDCLVISLCGEEQPVPIGLFINREQASKPVFPLWLFRTQGLFDPPCAVIYVSVSDALRENLAAAAIYRMLLRNRALMKDGEGLKPQEFRVFSVAKDGRGEFIEPERYLLRLQAERFEKKRRRRIGYVARNAAGQMVIQSGNAQFDVSVVSFGKKYLREVGRLHIDDRISFLPVVADGMRIAAEIRWIRQSPKASRCRVCA